VLTKIFQIDPKLTCDVFHILKHDHISKIEKIFDGTDQGCRTGDPARPPRKEIFIDRPRPPEKLFYSLKDIYIQLKVK